MNEKILIDNTNYYYENYNFVENDIYIKYIQIITEYIEQLEKLNYIKYKNIDFLIKQGIKTLTNVFKLIIIYSKNLDLTFNYSKKAVYYYVEFIKQIDMESNYIKLTSTDASLFVYKKTIFLIDNEFRKNYVSKYEEIENNLYLFTEIIKYNFDNLLNNIYIYNDLKKIYNDIYLFSSHIIDLSYKSTSNNINKNLKLIYNFNNIIVNLNIKNYIYLLCEFCNKKVYDYCKIYSLNNIILNNINLLDKCTFNYNNEISENENENENDNDYNDYINSLINELSKTKNL
jgi:hypothetical protein